VPELPGAAVVSTPIGIGDRVRCIDRHSTLGGEVGTVDRMEFDPPHYFVTFDSGEIAWMYPSDVERYVDPPMKTLRVGVGLYQPGDKVKYRAGRTKRASRIGTVIRTYVDSDEIPVAVVATPGGVTADIAYDELEMVREHDRPDSPSARGAQEVTVTFTFTPDEHIPIITSLDELLEILSESPDDLTIHEEPA